jgi:mannose-6-phosphate isomerase-like protein (cupin superfamily)
MVALAHRSFDRPDDTMRYPLARVDVVNAEKVLWWRLRLDPGWRYSESMGPADGTHICPGEHVFMCVLAGRLAIRMKDGTEAEFGPGDVGLVPPEHDSWVVGEEPVVAIGIDRR